MNRESRDELVVLVDVLALAVVATADVVPENEPLLDVVVEEVLPGDGLLQVAKSHALDNDAHVPVVPLTISFVLSRDILVAESKSKLVSAAQS